MFRDKSKSAIGVAVVALFVTLLNASPSDAAAVACPTGISKFNPEDGDVYFASAANDLKRYRVGHRPVQPITLKPDEHISLYYFTTPTALNTPMVFALIRAYKIRIDYPTSLLPTEVHVSNSLSPDRTVPTTNYTSFHMEKRHDPSALRTEFHMRFATGWFNWDNSYDAVSNPDIYALPNGSDFTGYKAYMQRISGFSIDGSCVTFTLFDDKSFAQAVESVSMVLVALAEKSDQAAETIRFSVNFSAGP